MLRRLFVLCAVLGGILYGEGAQLYQAVKMKTPIVLDGKVEEKVWQTALLFDKFIIHGTADRAAYPTQARLLHDSDALYVSFVCTIPDGGQLKANATKRNGDVYRDDCVEIMVDPNATGDRYFHFLVNANGAVYDRYCDQGGYVGNPKWSGDIQAKGFKGKGFWSVEVRIPFSTLDINPGNSRIWGFNFCRDNRLPYQESSVADGVFNNASAFVKVHGIDLDLDRYGWSIGKPVVTCGRNNAGKLTVSGKVDIGNQADKVQQALVDMVLIGKNGAATSSGVGAFAAGERRNVTLENMVLDAAGDYTCIVSIQDSVTKKIYKRSSFPTRLDFAPMEIVVRQPAYRHTIYATQKLTHVVYGLHSTIAPKLGKIVTGIRDMKGKVLAEENPSMLGEIRFPAADLPEGKMVIYAYAIGKDGTKYPEVTASLRKVPAHKGEVRMDDDGFWLVDGKRFFMVGEWNDVHVEGTNVSVANPTETKRGEKFITGNLMWSSFPARKSYRGSVISSKDEEIIRAEVQKFRDLPDFFAYYLADEPEISGVSAVGISRVADIVRDEDPYHPLIISNDTVAGIADYAEASEINGLHPYPAPVPGKPKSNFEKFVTYMEHAEAFNRGRLVPQTIAYLQQGFNYGDHGAANSRIPTFDEIRTQYLGAQIMGGRGILLYNRNTKVYPELYLGIPYIVRELNWYAPALLENSVSDGEIVCNNGKVRFMVKKHQGQLYIFAFSTIKGKVSAEFKGELLKGKKLHVAGEERVVDASNGAYTDIFDNFQVHVYTTVKPPEWMSLSTQEMAIQGAKSERAKQGNLAFQMYEYEKLKITASSNAASNRRADCCLWHVTDGIIPDSNAYYAVQQRWEATNAGAKWIELQFNQAVTLGRVEIYPVDDSLKKLHLEVEQEGKMVNVGEWTKVSSIIERPKVIFAPQKSSKLRIVVEETNGPAAKIAEIEVYEK